jgi:hypothetical protein
MSQASHLLSPIHAALGKQRWFPITGLRLLLLPGLCGAVTAAQPTNSLPDQIADVQFEMDKAIAQAQKIVNQPVAAFARGPGLQWSEFHPGWFHAGANKPDFNNVDVRTTQEKIYDKFEYVSSDLNPGVVFRGRDLEFNANTKYFYTDRSVPKKKLTEPEMLEINRLYRIIGRCEHQLADLQKPATAPETTSDTIPGTTAEAIVTRLPLLKSTPARVTLAVLLLLAVVYLSRRRST